MIAIADDPIAIIDHEVVVVKPRSGVRIVGGLRVFGGYNKQYYYGSNALDDSDGTAGSVGSCGMSVLAGGGGGNGGPCPDLKVLVMVELEEMSAIFLCISMPWHHHT